MVCLTMTTINTRKMKDKECLDKLGEIILVDGFQVWEPKQIIRKGRRYQLFLFERALLLTKEIKDATGHSKFVFKNKYMTAGMTIQESVEGGDELKLAIWLGGRISASSSSSDGKIILKASCLAVKHNWIVKLKEHICASANTTPSHSHSPTIVSSSKDTEDCLDLEGPLVSNERYSTISHSSSNTTDSSDKTFNEGDWASITENYQAIHDGELTVSKGECVEILDRSSSADTYYVRLRIAPSSASHKVAAVASGQKILEGYLPATVLSLLTNQRAAARNNATSPSTTGSMDPHNDDVFGSSSTVSLQSHKSASGLSVGAGQSCDKSQTQQNPPPTSKRRNTFRKWLTNPVRKLSQNRIELGTSPSSSCASASGSANNATGTGTCSAASSKTTTTSSSSSNRKPPAASVSHVTSAKQVPVQSPPLAQQEDWHEPHVINKSSSLTTTTRQRNDAANIINMEAETSDNPINTALPPEMPPPMHALNLTPTNPPSSSLAGPESELQPPSIQSAPATTDLTSQIENLVLNGGLSSPQSSVSEQSSGDLPRFPPPSTDMADHINPTADNNAQDMNKDNQEPDEEPVQPEIPEDPTARAVIMRDYVLRELVDTERDYVKDLGLIIDGYMAYMNENAMPDDMNGRDKLIFGNIQQIYVFHKDTFCGELEKCLDAADRLPQVFIRYERKFQMYVIYCQNKPKSEFIVSEYIDTYFEDIRLKLGHKLKLPDMLIKPVQRVMRYQLMLKDILKYTQRAHLPVADLQKAINCIMGVCKLANDFMEVGRLQGFEGKLTAQGKLLLQDSFQVCETVTAAAPTEKGKEKDKEKEKKEDTTQTNKFKDRQIFLFEQVVIFSEAVGGSHNKKQYSSPVYIYKSHIQVNKMSLIEVEKDMVRFALRSRCPHSGDRMFVIEAPDKEKRDLWVGEIKKMLDTQQNFLRALQSPIDFQRRAQQGDEVMEASEAAVPSPLAALPPVAAPISTRSADKPPETRLPKFLRPKSYIEDRRRTLSVTRAAAETPIIRYGGSFTTPISPPSDSSKPPASPRFLFPVASMKSVHSETDLTNKAKEASSSARSSLSGSTSSLAAPDQPDKSRRWSISVKRDKSPSASTPILKDIKSGLSFGKKH